MFTFGTDYFLFTFAASIGVLQIAASLGPLRGLLLLRSPLLARASGTALVAGALVWFFVSSPRNLNDYEGGLDANLQAMLFFMAALSALAATLAASFALNPRMAPVQRSPIDGLDALRYTTYPRAVARSVRYSIGRLRHVSLTEPLRERGARLGLPLGVIGLAAVILAVVWSSGPTEGVVVGRDTDSATVNELLHTDERAMLWTNGLVGALPLLDKIVEWVVSDYLVPVGMSLTLVALWFIGDRATRLRHQVGVLVALSSMALSSWAVYAINGLYFRPRPFVDHDVSVLFYYPTDSSFPSNPAAVSFAIAAVVWGINRRVGSALLVAAAAFGFARVYAGVHYPADIIAGALIGVVVAALVFRLKDLIEPLPSMVIRVARALCLA